MDKNAYKKYVELIKALGYVRWRHLGRESAEEDGVLEQMDGLWWHMSDEDRNRAETVPVAPALLYSISHRRSGTTVLNDIYHTIGARDCRHRIVEEIA